MTFMSKETALKIILVLSAAGSLFSGYLSYKELFAENCALGCTSAGTIFGLPVCVYGFLMFLIVFLTALLGQTSKKS